MGLSQQADLIDRYVEIVEGCLVGDCRLKERTGDEVMIVSESPDSLLASAYQIMNATSREDNFLQVHGGLHYGNVLKRRDSYFGSSINLTSRIAAKADPGTFWCSEEFINSLSDKSLVQMHAKGKHSFKNVSGDKEMFEMRSDDKKSFFIDSVCKMLILDTNKAVKHPTSEDTFFCSGDCLDIFLKNQSNNSRAD
jgi:class 3 adenylate cyclase